MKTRWVSSVSIVLLAGMLGACAPAAQGTAPLPVASATPQSAAVPPIPLKVSMANFAAFAPIYIAQKEGYYADEGLDVELVTFTKYDEMIPALATGQIDVVAYVLSASIFNAISEGLDIKFVADKGYLNPNASCASDAWVASDKALAAGLSDPAMLKGKKVSVARGGQQEYVFQRLLDQGGLTMADVDTNYISDSSALVEALRTGGMDVAALNEPWITIAENSGAGKVWKRFADLRPNMPAGLILYGPTILEKNHEAGVRFMAAYLRGVQQFNEGKTDRNVQLIAEFTKLKPEDLKNMCWNSFRPDGSVDTDAMLAYQKWAVDRGLVDKPLELNQFWTDDFIKEAATRLGK